MFTVKEREEKEQKNRAVLQPSLTFRVHQKLTLYIYFHMQHKIYIYIDNEVKSGSNR